MKDKISSIKIKRIPIPSVAGDNTLQRLRCNSGMGKTCCTGTKRTSGKTQNHEKMGVHQPLVTEL